jgi:hypothetical protein
VFELHEQLAITSFTRNAQLVANNITTLRKASDLATAPSITAAGIDDLHQALLPDEQHRGQRSVQNWIGGNAQFETRLCANPRDSALSRGCLTVRRLSGG